MNDKHNQLDWMIGQARKGRMTRREFVGRTTALGVSATLAGALFSKAALADEPVKGGTLRLGVLGGESTNTLDPALSASPAPYSILRTWGETLVDVSETGTVEMRIAEEVSSNADATEWKFKIRSGVQFHDGATVTADDVVATLKRHTDEKSQSGALGIVQGISEMSAEGDTVTLKLASANADLPFLMADYHLIIQPGGGVDNPAAGIGTGPYKVVSNEAGVITTFEKNANYWDSSRGHADSVEILVINDDTARVAALQAGQVHMIDRVDPKTVASLSGDAGVVIERAAGPGH